MIIYSATKQEFNRDVILNRISDVILDNFRKNNILGGQSAEFASWQNSLHFMRDVLDDAEISSDINIAIEYQIPRTSKRVDFMIAGSDAKKKDNIVIVELKQWEKAEKINDEMSHCVKAYTGGGNRIVSHPSYQAYSYACFLKNSAELVQENNVGIFPCAYLHNYQPSLRYILNDSIYKVWYEEAPFFVRNDTLKIREFIKKYVSKKSSSGDLLYQIDNGRIRPSKSLQDCLASLMQGNNEFILLDDQSVAYDICKSLMKKCKTDSKKRTVIIQGGPGTGKSVLAINLLKEFTCDNLNAAYCTKNAAPKSAYKTLLTKANIKSKAIVEHLFRSPFGLSNVPSNSYDCLIVDEAHRLVKKMYGDWNGENQIRECINASLLTVFLIDENQRITTKDIGSIEGIKEQAKLLESMVIYSDETILKSQFRCNGSDAYIQLVENLLQIGEPVDVNNMELSFDIQIFDNPCQMREKLREKNINNKARMVAGYCYDWNVKNKKGDYDIYLENGFMAKWNLEGDSIWAINPNSFEEVGCIHTAQGLEFDYVGVIIGRDIKYNPESGLVETDKSMVSKDDKSSGIRTARDDIASQLIKNTYKTLLTRGQKGCYIYCEDKNFRDYIKNIIQRINRNP